MTVKRAWGMVVLILALTGCCGAGAPIPTATPQPEMPTATPMFGPTATPTFGPSPTPFLPPHLRTPTPTPPPTPIPSPIPTPRSPRGQIVFGAYPCSSGGDCSPYPGMEDDFGLYIINSDGTDLQQITEEELFRRRLSVNELVQWLPDGTAWVEAGMDGLYIFSADGERSTRLVETPTGSFSISPDGRHIVYKEEILPNGVGMHDITIYSISIDGSEWGELAKLQTFKGADLRWSPGGDQILVAVPRSGLSRPADLYLINLRDNGEQRTRHLFHIEEWLLDPQWSPDGQRIEFILCDEERTNTFLSIGKEGDDQQQIAQITGLGGCVGHRVWSPDNNQFAFSPFLLPWEGLYLFDVNSRHYWQILSGYNVAGPMIWLPEP